MSVFASMHRGVVAVASPVVTSLCLASPPALAQVLCHYPTVSCRAPGSCADAPPLCGGAASQNTTGVWEFDIYPGEQCAFPLSAMRFGLTWPAAWTVVSWETCGGATAVGNLQAPGDGLEVTFPSCSADEVAVRLVMNCTTPGRLSFTQHPGGGFDFRGCGSPQWYGFESVFTYVEIGDYCGVSPIAAPCDYYCGHGQPAASFSPPAIVAAAYEGGRTTVPLSVSMGAYCPFPPECGQGPPYGDCLTYILPTEPWIQLTQAGTGPYGQVLYAVRLDAAGLAPGTYTGRIETGKPSCAYCHETCAQVNLEVLACGPPLERSALPAGVVRRVPDDYPTIGAALAASQPGDTVGVRGGAYTESFSPRDGVAVLGGYDPTFSTRDPELYETILSGNAARIATCLGCVGPTAVMDGFTWNGGGVEEGGLVLVESASPTLSNNRFEGAHGGRGGAVSIVGSSALLEGNRFTDNESAEVGGALSIFGSEGVLVRDCRFEGNTAAASGGGVFVDGSFDVAFSRCVFFDNQATASGGGLLLQNSLAVVDGCVFAGNAGDRGAAVGVFSYYPSSVTSCTIAGNAAATGGGGVFVAGKASITRSIVAGNSARGLYATPVSTLDNSCNDVWNNVPADYYGVTPGPESFSLDPLFCDLAGRDFTLEVDSPCAPAHAPAACGLVGALPATCIRRFLRVPVDYPSIVLGLNAAGGGDTVAVAEGFYAERITLKERVRLLGGWRNDFGERDPIAFPAVIDAGGLLSAVVAQSGETKTTVIDGFVITGGNQVDGFGGGIACVNASPTIRNNVLRNNRAGRGAAISCRSGAAPVIIGNVLVDNVGLAFPGAAIYLEGADARIESNTLDGNEGPSASGIAVRAGAVPVITRNIVVNGTSGVGVFADQGSAPQMSCNDVWQNAGGGYYGVLPGPGALNLDPRFCPGEDRFLNEDSPCAPANAPPQCGLIGAREVGCTATGVADLAIAPARDWIAVPYPNPVNPVSMIAYGMARASRVRLTIVDIAGRKVRTLVDQVQPAGEHRVLWDGTDDPGRPVASGVYLYQLAADGRVIGNQKVLVLRQR